MRPDEVCDQGLGQPDRQDDAAALPVTPSIGQVPEEDHFTDHWNTYVQGEQADIRDEPYRRYGPRGVRAMDRGTWGFFSVNCLSG